MSGRPRMDGRKRNRAEKAEDKTEVRRDVEGRGEVVNALNRVDCYLCDSAVA